MLESTDLLDELLGDVRDRDVLDVGCGDGWLVRRLVAAGARARGVDPSPAALDEARRADPDVAEGRFVAAGAERLPFEDASYDAVVFFNSLHHVPEQSLDAALAEATRVLRDGGLLYVQEPVADGEFFDLVRSVDDETHVRAMAQAALDRASGGRLTELARRDAPVALRLADFEALRRLLIGADAQRAGALDEQEPSMRAAFERAGRRTEAGWEFATPATARLLRRDARG